MAKKTDAASDLAADEAAEPLYFRVELQHAPTHVVEAVDPANAWEEYRRELGVLNSEYQPQVFAATAAERQAAVDKLYGVDPRDRK